MERTASNVISDEKDTLDSPHGVHDSIPEGTELPPPPPPFMGLNKPSLRAPTLPSIVRLKQLPPPISSTALYHTTSIDESQEVGFGDYESDMSREMDLEEPAGGAAAFSRVSSCSDTDGTGIHWLDTEKSRSLADGDRLEAAPAAATGLQARDDDIFDLPVGQGGPDTKRKLCILSLDGGGMRGLIAARMLTRLESLIQAKVGGGKVHLADYFDLFSGTSTGAVLATMLVTPNEKGEPLFTADGCCRFYQEQGKYIFKPHWYDPFHGSLRQLYRPKYSARRFENLLKLYTVRKGQALTLLDTLKPIVVTSFDISKATPFFFVRHAATKDPSHNFRLWEVCRATAAAPTYFPPAYVTSVDGTINGTLIDGGAIQNNPALVATTHALSNNEEFPEATSLQDILILSLGAGQMDKTHELSRAKKWGMTGWVRPIMDIMMDGTADTVDYQLATAYAGQNCSENYLRIQLSGLPNKTSIMDCATQENIKDLIQCSDSLLKQPAVMRNGYGEKVSLQQTNDNRLSWFADQLIIQKQLREEGPKNPSSSNHSLSPYAKESLGPTARLVSPLFVHLFEHHRELANITNMSRSVRF
ncbi:unnamed protein product [Sphagnum jensenii]|uniref:Patatin n=1 Tax=Sphagnum jensenii TaxID=128206 RepID=A0ABP1AUD2_9BRYO